MKSFKIRSALAATLGIVLAWLLSVHPVQAGYVVTLQQVGPDVVATGSGALNLFALPFSGLTKEILKTGLSPNGEKIGAGTFIYTVTPSSVDVYNLSPTGPASFGTNTNLTFASSGSGDLVGILLSPSVNFLVVPTGYVSDTALSDMAIYPATTFATLGVTPGTYEWTWGLGANENFTLEILPGILPPTQSLNISTRANVGTGDKVLIGGIIISGSDPATIVFRALGRSLATFGITGALDNPTLELHDSTGAQIAINSNWKDNKNKDKTVLTSNGLAPTDDFESAIVITLDPGAYTAIVSGENNTGGVSVVEAYNLSSGTTDSKFANISTRVNVGTGENVMIGGFILGGGGGGFSEVIVRGLGPSLTAFGITGALADPFLELHDSQGTAIAANDNWMDDPNMATVADRGLAPSNPNESAIFQVLPSGPYTAILSGVGGTTGVGLVESYDVNL